MRRESYFVHRRVRLANRFAAGLVAVEEQHDLLREALDQPRVSLRKRGAHGSNRILKPSLVKRDQVEVAFTQDGGVLAPNLDATFVQPVEHLSFVVERILGTVEVFSPAVPSALPSMARATTRGR